MTQKAAPSHTRSPLYLILDLILELHIYLRQNFYDSISLRSDFFIQYSAHIVQQHKTMEDSLMFLLYVLESQFNTFGCSKPWTDDATNLWLHVYTAAVL